MFRKKNGNSENPSVGLLYVAGKVVEKRIQRKEIRDL
jgi:hypothetical protein